jgi:hypothetical protein
LAKGLAALFKCFLFSVSHASAISLILALNRDRNGNSHQPPALRIKSSLFNKIMPKVQKFLIKNLNSTKIKHIKNDGVWI